MKNENAKNILTNKIFFCYTLNALGGVAQLGERLTGSQEVNGSIPSVSTKNPVHFCERDFYLLLLTFSLLLQKRNASREPLAHSC